MSLAVIEDPREELSQMVSEGAQRRHLSVSPDAQAYVVSVILALTLADDVYTAREKPFVDGDRGRHMKPFTFQLQEAADRPYLFKEVGDRCLFVLGVYSLIWALLLAGVMWGVYWYYIERDLR